MSSSRIYLKVQVQFLKRKSKSGMDPQGCEDIVRNGPSIWPETSRISGLSRISGPLDSQESLGLQEFQDSLDFQEFQVSLDFQEVSTLEGKEAVIRNSRRRSNWRVLEL